MRLFTVKARTFTDSFEEQLEISEKLYGSHITFSYTEADINSALERANNYSPEEQERVKEIRQMKTKGENDLVGELLR